MNLEKTLPKNNRLITLKILVVLWLLFMSYFSFAQPNVVTDIDTNPSNVPLTTSIGMASNMYQSFTPTQDGRLVRIDLVVRANSTGVRQLDIYDGEGLGGTLLHTQSVTSQEGMNEYELSVPIPVIGGQLYTFALNDTETAFLGSGNDYTGGRSFITVGGVLTEFFDTDFAILLDLGTNTNLVNRGDFTNEDPITFDLALFGDVVGLDLSVFQVTNGTASSLVEDTPGNYLLEVTPSGEGLVTVNMLEGALIIDGIDSDATMASTTYDITPPDNQDLIFANDRLFTSGGQVIFNNPAVTPLVYFAPEGTTDFTPGPTTVRGSIVSMIDPPGCVPMSEVTCPPDPMTGMPDPACVPMPEVICSTIDNPVLNAPTSVGAYKLFVLDEAGNISEASEATLFVTTETHATASKIIVNDTQLLTGETTEVNFLFLGPVTDFTNDDLSVESGTLSTVISTDGNISFNAIFTPNAGVDNTGFAIVIINSQITDGSTAGSGFTLSNEYGVHTLAPAITSIQRQTPTDETTGADEVTFRVTFNVPIDAASFGASDFTLSGTAAGDGTIGTATMVNSTTYDYTVTGLTNSNGTIGLDYSGDLYYIEPTNTIVGGDPAGEEIFTLINNTLSFESTPITAGDQNAEYTYPIEVSSSFGGIGLTVTATNIPDWLTLTQTDTITNFLGNSGSRGNEGDGGPVSQATFQQIQDQLYDSQGNLYLLDINNHRIRVVGTDGNINAFAGSGTAGFSGDGSLAINAEFNFPSAIAIDGSDNIYVIDRGNARIRKIDAVTNIISTVAGNGTSGFSGDGGLATEASINAFSFNLAVSSTGEILLLEGSRIRKIDGSGIISTIGGDNSFSSFVEGALATETHFSGAGMALDASDNIFITTREHAIRRIDAETNIITTVAGTGVEGFSGDGGSALNAQFSFDSFTGITIDGQGNIFVADRGNRRIRAITLDGMVETIAGNGAIGSAGNDGDALDASLFLSSHIALGLEGNILLAESRQLRSVQTNRALLSGIPANADVGFNQIDLTVSNGIISTDQNFSISIADVNDLPELVGAEQALTATQGATFEQTVSARDVDGDLIDIEITASPDWLTAEVETNLFTFTSGGAFSDIAFVNDLFYLSNIGTNAIFTTDQLGQNLTRLAGADDGSSGFVDGDLASARFDTPFAVDVAPNGDIYVIDQGNHALRKISNNMVSTIAGNGTAGFGDGPCSPTLATFDTPNNLLIAPNGDIYISDAGNGVIRILTEATGEVTTLQDAGGNNIAFDTPYGLALDGNGVLYVTDNGGHTIWSIDGNSATLLAGEQGVLGNVDGTASDARFDEPSGIVANADGSLLYVAEATGNVRKIEIDESGSEVSTIVSTADTPVGLLVNPLNNSLLYGDLGISSIIETQFSISLSGIPTNDDVGTNEVNVTLGDGMSETTEVITINVVNVNDAPTFTSTAPISTIEDEVFSYTLEAMDIDNDALLYSATTLPSWLTLQQTNPVVTTFAGNGNNDFVSRGTLLTQFGIGTVDAVAVNAEGVVYIGSDNRVLKVEDNEISIIAGNGFPSGTGDGGPAVDAQINSIADMHIGPDGSIYLSTNNGQFGGSFPVIRKISTDGIITTIAGVSNASFESTGDGGLATAASFAGLRGVFVDSDGNIYAADGNNSIRRIGTDGIINTVATNVSNVFDMVLDDNGNIYAVTDGSTGLLVIDENDVQTEVISQFSAINITLDNVGNIYGITRGTSHVLQYNINSTATGANVIANSAGVDGFSGDGGPASEATFNMPSAIASGLNGDIFVADNGNSRIRQLVFQNPVLSGTPTQLEVGDNEIVIQVSDGELTAEQSFTLEVINLTEVIEVSSGLSQTFGIGDEIQFQVSFDGGGVNITEGDEVPTILLETGTVDRVATFSGGAAGADNMQFTYTVQEGDVSNDLDYNLAEINPGVGTTITSNNGNDVVLILPTVGSASSLSGTSAIVVDGILPVIDVVSVTSNNASSANIATIGDVITVSFSTSEPLGTSPTVSLGGTAISVLATTNTNEYSGTITVENGTFNEGTAGLMVTITDLAGNENTQDLSEQGATISIDTLTPTLTNVSFSSNNENDSFFARVGDEITLSFTLSDDVLPTNPVVTIAGNVVTVVEDPTIGFIARYTMTADDTEGQVSFTLDFSDEAGNVANQVTDITNGLVVTFDRTNPTIVDISTTTNIVNEPFDVTFSFSEVVNDFTIDDIVLSVEGGATIEGAISNFSGSFSGFSATITPPAEGMFEIAVPAGVVTDNAGNANTVAPSFFFEYDITNPTVTITNTTGANPTNGAFEILIEVSEETANTVRGDELVVENGTASNFAGNITDGFTAIITPTTEGEVTMRIEADVITDRAGNGNEASNILSVAFDNTNPTVEITTGSASPTNTVFDVNITFSEEVSDFTIDDLTLTNATASDFSGSGSSYVVQINPSADGVVSVAVASGVAIDNAGNGNTVSNTLSVDYDATNPTVVLSTGSASPTNTVFDVNITFSEEVSDFTIDDLALTNATASDFSGSGSNYVFQVNPTLDGTVTVAVASDVAADNAGNGNSVSNTLSVDYDTTNPTVVLSTGSASLTNTVFDVNITFNEDVSGFTIDDLVLTNATASDFSGSGSNYVFQVNPTLDGTVTIAVASDVATDNAGNGNVESNTLSLEYDISRPSVIVSTSTMSPTNAAFNVSIVFAESVTGFIAEDIVVSNGVLSDFTGSGTNYTATISPSTDGLVEVNVPEGVAIDQAGNENSISNTLQIEFDDSALSIVITTEAMSPVNSSFDITMTFSEEVTGFEMDDISIVNGTLENLVGSGAIYNATINPIENGDVIISIAENVAINMANNGNQASNEISILFDGISPTVILTSDVVSPTNDAFEVMIDFSEEVNGFELSNIEISNGVASNLSGNGANYTVTVTPTTDGSVTLNIPQNSAMDLAGNENESSNTLTVEFDSTAPVVTITTLAASPTNGSFEINIDFNEEVTGFSIEDILVINGSASNLSNENGDFSATITPLANGEVMVSILAATAFDAAGNGNELSNVLIVEFDNTLISTEIVTSASSLVNGPFDIEINFSEPVQGFDITDLIINNGTASNLIGMEANYTATVTPITDGTVTVELVSGSVTGINDNDIASAILTIQFDGTVPTLDVVEITSDNTEDGTTAIAGNVITISLTASEELLNIPTVTIMGRNADVLSDGQNSFIASIEVLEGDDLGVVPFTIDFVDLAGNNGIQVSNTTNDSAVEIIAEVITSTNNIPQSIINIYPNPAIDDINIQLSDFGDFDEVILYNLSGVAVLRKTINQETTQLNVAAMDAGLYFLVLMKDGEYKSQEKVLLK